MGSFKDFDAAQREQEQEPIRFRLGGQDFQVRAVPAGALLRLARMAEAEGAEALVQFDGFLASIIQAEDRERWQSVMDRVTTATLLDVAQFIIEEATGRPTEQPSASVDRLPNNGSASNTASPDSERRTA